MKIKLTNCKLKKNTQLGLLEHYLMEVTARSAADLLDIHPNTAAILYKKIRQIISFHLALQASEAFDSCIELDESCFDGVRKGKREEVRLGSSCIWCLKARWQSLDCRC